MRDWTKVGDNQAYAEQPFLASYWNGLGGNCDHYLQTRGRTAVCCRTVHYVLTDEGSLTGHIFIPFLPTPNESVYDIFVEIGATRLPTRNYTLILYAYTEEIPSAHRSAAQSRAEIVIGPDSVPWRLDGVTDSLTPLEWPTDRLNPVAWKRLTPGHLINRTNPDITPGPRLLDLMWAWKDGDAPAFSVAIRGIYVVGRAAEGEI